MKNKKFFLMRFALALSLLMILSACSATNSTEKNAVSSSSATSAASMITSVSAVTAKYESEDYYFNWKKQSYQTINLNSGSAAISKSGIYEVTGTLQDGSVVVDVDKTADDGIIYLILNNADISSSTSAPIYIKNAEKVVLILESGTQNTISQGSGCVADESGVPSSAIFSKADLTITGGGKLSVTSDYNDGITCKDDLKITDGTLIINAKSDGIVGKDMLAVEKANITITAGKDGMRSTNETDEGKGNVVISGGEFTITSNNDAIQAYSLLQIDGGTFNITTCGGYPGKSINANSNGGMGGRPGQTQAASDTDTDTTESQKALKASQSIIINDGTFAVSAYDDSIHSNGDITINGGTFTMQTGDDGISSDANVKITGGDITIENCYESIEGTNITVEGSKINATSSDDGFNVNNSSGLLTISGGDTYLNAGGDGVDSNGSVKMTGGTVYVDGPTSNANGPIDYDQSFTISGGTIAAAGSSGMAQAASSDSSQPSVLMYYTSAQSAGTALTLKDSSDNEIITVTPAKEYASVCISSPKLSIGSSYTLYSGDTKLVTFTLSDNTTYLNESGVTTQQSGGGPGGGGFGGGGPGHGSGGGFGGPRG